MKRAELMAWAALGALLVIAVILLAGGLAYHVTGWWAGMMLASGQAVVVALAAWGLMLARQVREMRDDAGPTRGGLGLGVSTHSAKPEVGGGFRMSVGDDGPTSGSRGTADSAGDGPRLLDTGFQRLMSALAGSTLVILAAVCGWLLYTAYTWQMKNPDQMLPLGGTYDNPLKALDELALVIGVGAAGIYGTFWWLTRRRRGDDESGAAVAGTFSLGFVGMCAMGAATILGYLHVSWASEVSAGVLALLMLLQGFELLVNSGRSYANVEEVDQEAVDLQAMPLVPMLSSVWLAALSNLFAQGVGISLKRGKQDKGVIGRMMPRALAAMLLIAILLSCVRVVAPGTMAVRERFGSAPWDEKTNSLEKGALLGEGLHFTLPWPMDQLVTIPTEQLQETKVGAELHAPKNWQNVDFQFWYFREPGGGNESENEFVTGDAGAPQILEAFVDVRWRVKDPEKFYSMLSHSDFYEKSAEGTEAQPVYEAIVQRCAEFAVTRTFAIHSLDQIMIDGRSEVESHCREILQKKLDSLRNGNATGSGIFIESLVIKDLHPPFWHTDQPNNAEPEIGPVLDSLGNKVARGPASAFEFVISMREWKETQVNRAEESRIQQVNMAKGDAAAAIADAKSYSFNHIGQAQGDVSRFLKTTDGMDPQSRDFELGLLRQNLQYSTLKDAIDPVYKIISDPRVDIQVYQTSENQPQLLRPPGM